MCTSASERVIVLSAMTWAVCSLVIVGAALYTGVVVMSAAPDVGGVAAAVKEAGLDSMALGVQAAAGRARAALDVVRGAVNMTAVRALGREL